MADSMAIHRQALISRTDSTLSSSSFAASSQAAGDYNPLSLPYNNYLEKRQLFLRSYQFRRKKSFSDRLRSSLLRIRRAIGLRLRSVRRLRRVVCSRLRRRRLYWLVQQYSAGLAGDRRSGCSDSCFW